MSAKPKRDVVIEWACERVGKWVTSALSLSHYYARG